MSEPLFAPLFDGPGIDVEARASSLDVDDTARPRGPIFKGRTTAGLATAAKMREIADRMDKDIDHACRSMSQNATPKRLREYRSRCHDGENMKRTQKALRALADLHEDGSIPRGLSAFKTKSAVAPLVHKSTLGGGY